MKNYRIAFVGLGSIATRHLKNVNTYLASVGDSCTVDLYRSSLGRPLADELQPLEHNDCYGTNSMMYYSKEGRPDVNGILKELKK